MPLKTSVIAMEKRIEKTFRLRQPVANYQNDVRNLLRTTKMMLETCCELPKCAAQPWPTQQPKNQ